MTGSGAGPQPGAVAAIDCGTNSTRLLVLDASGRRLDREMRITRLGQGVDRTGRLAPEAIERTVTVLREYRAVLDSLGVTPDRMRVATTSASRDAENSMDFLEAAEQVLGVCPSVIPGDEEGRLSWLGATSGLGAESGLGATSGLGAESGLGATSGLRARGAPTGHPDGGLAVVVDVGGGSTELICGVPGDAAPLAVESMDIGCVRATERYLHGDPPGPHELQAARDETRRLVEGVVTQHPEMLRSELMIGLAGTVSALTVLSLGLDGFDEAKVHHARLRLDAVRELTDRLASLPLAQRRLVRGIEVARADVLVGGALVLGEVMGALGFDELLVSESDILDGMARGLLPA